MLAAVRILLLFLCSLPLWADVPLSSWYSLNDKKQASLQVELFLSSTCPHCHKADLFFQKIEAKTPWLEVHRNLINEDKEALSRFGQYLSALNINDFAVPSIFFCKTRWVGFDTVQTTGKDLVQGLEFCKEQIEKKGKLTEPTIEVLNRQANANMLNNGVIEKPSTLHYFFIVSLLDSSNPCALFGFGCFLALLFIQDNRKNQWISGFLFIAAVLVVHYIQQTQPNFFFQILPWLRVFAVLIGLLSLYLVYQLHKNKPVPAKLIFIWTFIFSLFIQAYQQTCIMNWSYIFEQWLFNQPLSAGQQHIMQSVYQLLYITPLVVILSAYLLLNKFKFLSSLKPALRYIGLLCIAITALFLTFYPQALSYYLQSLLILLVTVFIGLYLNSIQKNKK